MIPFQQDNYYYPFNPYIPPNWQANVAYRIHPYPANHWNMHPLQQQGMPTHYPNMVQLPKYSNLLFQNPLQPDEEFLDESYAYNNFYQNSPNIFPIPRPSPLQTVLQSFKTKDGSLDINKMVYTAGQLIQAFNQVTGMAKGLGSIFK